MRELRESHESETKNKTEEPRTSGRVQGTLPAGLPISKDYDGIFFSMHLGIRLSMEILDGFNDNYMAFSAQFSFMSFPGISVEMSIIPTQARLGCK